MSRNTWEQCGRKAQQLREQMFGKPQPLTQEQREQKQEQLVLLRKQISSLKGHHGVAAYEKLGELLAQVRALEAELR